MMKQMLGLLVVFSFVQCKKDKNDNNPLKKGLLAVYNLDNNYKDSTGKSEVIVYSMNGITAIADRHKRLESAMNFDGGKIVISVKDWKSFPISISVWANPKDGNNDDFMIWSENKAFGIYQLDAKMGIGVGAPVKKLALGALFKGWNHIVGTYDGKELRTYINGALKTTVEYAGEPDITKGVYVGSAGSAAWKGSVDDIRFYNRILTDEEIDLLAKQ